VQKKVEEMENQINILFQFILDDAGASPSKMTVHMWRQTYYISAWIEFMVKDLTQNLIGLLRYFCEKAF